MKYGNSKKLEHFQMKEQHDQRYSGMKVNEAQGTLQFDFTLTAVGDEPEKLSGVTRTEMLLLRPR